MSFVDLASRGPSYRTATPTFELYGTVLAMSTYDHPKSGGQTERAKRELEDILRVYLMAQPSASWAMLLPHAVVYNSFIQASMCFSPRYAVLVYHPRFLQLLDSSV
ncbi:hypothetical protein H310_14198 [Aphanomyces invadans]|uniref:Integrase catalytic domain-containing protein n=1 Tax=Aphanomyces invadans TaxID=157072 RepID=A0A024TAX3_9STRA|nr:hypothetical protein H310_14198 [Aphanomyces invadans]ETV91198.1 hypothetical protein H310_14198 [Aphanomyces invadans]|eukprot:XP_008880229.1 hypothetical protein H310_14198 [Aphanomyces invadans]